MFVLSRRACRAIGLGDPWVPVPDARDVVVGVEIATAVGVGHPRRPGAATTWIGLAVGERLDRRAEGRASRRAARPASARATASAPNRRATSSQPVVEQGLASIRGDSSVVSLGEARRPRGPAPTRQDEIAIVTAARAAMQLAEHAELDAARAG